MRSAILLIAILICFLASAQEAADTVKSKVLDEIVVKEEIKPFRIEEDKLVFNPKFIPEAVNANALMRNLPGIIDLNGTIAMPGKDGIKIYVDGRELQGSNEEVMLLLKSYASKDIAKIEVMTSPSTRYTMGRNVGVINIVLKKRLTDFLGGTASYSFLQDNRTSNELSAGVFYKGKKINTSLNLTGSLKKYSFIERQNTDFGEYNRYNRKDADRDKNNMTLRWMLGYDFSKKWTASMGASLILGKMKETSANKSIYDIPSFPQMTTAGSRSNKDRTLAFFVETRGNISDKSNIAFNMDYYHRNYPNDYRIETQVESHNKNTADNFTFKSYYTYMPVPALSLSAGIDAIISGSNSKMKSLYSPDIKDSNSFDYDENEISPYAEAKYKFHQKWTLRGSVRYQYINTKFNSDKEPSHKRDFDAVSPRISLSYNISDIQGVQMSFNSNINKPTLTSINPHRFYIGDNTYRVGNPDLKESIHHILSLSYWWDELQLMPYVEWLNDGVTEIARTDGRQQLFTWENASDRRTLGMMIYYAFAKWDFMNISATSFISHNKTKSDNPQLEPEKSAFRFSIQPRIQFYLDKSKKYVLALYGTYSSREKSVEGVFNPQWRMDAAFSCALNPHWNLSVTGLNLLRSHSSGYLNMGDRKMSFNNKYMYTGVEVSLSYSWGVRTRPSRERAVVREMNNRTEIK